MENTGQDMGRQQRRVFQHESRADHDSARLLWHLGSEQPVYLALPAQRSSLLATHNNMVQKTTALFMLAEHISYYNS